MAIQPLQPCGMSRSATASTTQLFTPAPPTACNRSCTFCPAAHTCSSHCLAPSMQEHAYYGSFGYHVTNFFGVSSRCGTPDELKSMIDEAHR